MHLPASSAFCILLPYLSSLHCVEFGLLRCILLANNFHAKDIRVIDMNTQQTDLTMAFQ